MHRTLYGCILAAILLTAASLTGCNLDNVTMVREGKPVGRVWSVNEPGSEGNAKLRQQLRKPLKDVDFDQVKFGDAIQHFRDVAKVNIHIRRGPLRVRGSVKFVLEAVSGRLNLVQSLLHPELLVIPCPSFGGKHLLLGALELVSHLLELLGTGLSGL